MLMNRENGENDVTIEILYCGMCHTDLHYARNDWGITMYPVVPGYIYIYIYIFYKLINKLLRSLFFSFYLLFSLSKSISTTTTTHSVFSISFYNYIYK